MRRIVVVAAVAALLIALAPSPSVAAAPDGMAGPDQLLIERLDPERISYHAETGWVRFLGGSHADPVQAAGATSSPLVASRAFLEVYGSLFGLTAPKDELPGAPPRRSGGRPLGCAVRPGLPGHPGDRRRARRPA